MTDETLDLKRAAELLAVHPNTVKKHARSGKIPGWKVGGQWRFRKNTLERRLSPPVPPTEAEREPAAATSAAA